MRHEPNPESGARWRRRRPVGKGAINPASLQTRERPGANLNTAERRRGL